MTQSHKNTDPIVETKSCRHCASSFDITQADVDFYEKISPKFPQTPTLKGPPPLSGGNDAGEVYIAHIHTPTLCPDCRQRRRLSFRNERKLYRRICDASQQPIISIYKPGSDYTVYDQKIWWSDSRDPMDYGRDFDFTRSFTEQFGEMMREVPRMSLVNDYALQENSDYINLAGPSNRCYLIFETNNCDDCMYSYWIRDSQHCLDSYYIHNSSHCFQSFSLNNCHNVLYSVACKESSFLEYCSNCTNCSNCFMCYGLEGSNYCILNKQYSKKEYEEIMMESSTSTKNSLQTKYKKWLDTNQFRPSFIEYGNEKVCNSKMVINSTKSEYIEMCQGVINCKFGFLLNDATDCYDYMSWGENSSLMYEVHNSGKNCYNHIFSEFCWMNCDNIAYSNLCPMNNSHLFGCIGLRNKSYCIFNKQYTKEEYNILVPKIIEHMKNPPQSPFIKGEVEPERGEFFHPSLSPFGYNETVAQEYFPSTKSDIYTYGYKRSDYEPPAPQSDKVVDGSKLPEYGCKIIHEKKPEYLQDILRYAIRCEVSEKLFRLQSAEIQFYIKHNIPLPRKHPDVRHAERMELRR